MSHTEGKVSIGNGTQHEPATMVYVHDSMGSAIANCFMSHALLISHEEMKANARRLVACWNACEGWSTESLEEFADGNTKALVEDQGRAIQERDELVNMFAEWWMNDACANSHYFNEAVKRSPALARRMQELLATHPEKP